ncbi:hypothetical protein ACLB2K_050090 [Fragaria x ananassa]
MQSANSVLWLPERGDENTASSICLGSSLIPNSIPNLSSNSSQEQCHPISSQGQCNPSSSKEQCNLISNEGQCNPSSSKEQCNLISNEGQFNPISNKEQCNPVSSQVQLVKFFEFQSR